MGGSDESPVSTAKMFSVRSSKHSSNVSYPLFAPSTENHGVHIWAGIRTVPSPASKAISNKSFEGNPSIGLPSDLIFPTASSLLCIFFTASNDEDRIRLCTFLTLPFFL